MTEHHDSPSRAAALPALDTLAAAPVPVVVAPMAGGPSTPALVAAAIRAGGSGVLAGGMKTPEAVRAEVDAVRALLVEGTPESAGAPVPSDAPGAREAFASPASPQPLSDAGAPLRLGVNLFVPDAANTLVRARDRRAAAARLQAVAAFAERLRPVAENYGAAVPSAEGATPDPATERAQFEAFLALAEEQAWPWVTFTFGLPAPQVFARLTDAGVVPGVTVTDVAEARAAVQAGARLLVVQGPDAGGHRGTLDPAAEPGTVPLVQLVGAVRAACPEVPLLAAGGISTAEQARAALEAGADAVQAGTAFLRTPEAGTSAAHRVGMARAAGGGAGQGAGERADTTVTRAFTGRYARGLTVPFMSEFSDAPAAYPEVNVLTGALRKAAAAAMDLKSVHLWAGTGAHRAREVPAAEVLRTLAP
ncbi:NAD(P)H-dependent flavin oxidoreductase [Micrococcus luteus]